MSYDRRTILKLTGATAAASATGLAGCMDLLSSGDDDPGYDTWVADDEDGFYVAAVDWEAFQEVDELESDRDDEDEDEVETEDPMLETPMIGGALVAVSVGWGLAGTGLESLVDEEEEAFDATVDEVIYVDDGFVLHGAFEVDELADALEDDEDDVAYEASGDAEGYDVYELAENDTEFLSPPGAIGVNEDAIVVADVDADDEPVAALEDLLAVGAGDGDRAVETNDDFAWLVEEAGDGDLLIGFYGEEPDETDDGDGLFGETTGLLASFSLEGDGSASADFAATFDAIDDELEAELEADLGSSADEVELELEDDRVSASASWDAYGEELE